MKKLMHVITGLLAWHVLAHGIGEALHEAAIEVAISPVMHVTEKAVAGAMEAKPEAAAVAAAMEANPNLFHAHHKKEAK